MKRNVPWWVSLIIAAVFYFVSFVFSGSVVGDAAGVGGLIFLLLGIVGGITAAVKRPAKK